MLNPVLHFRLDFVAKLLNFELFGQMLVDLFEPDANVGGFEHILLVGRRQGRKRGCDEVHKTAWLFDIHRHGRELVRKRRRPGNDLLEKRKHVALQGFDLRTLGRNGLRHRVHAAPHERGQLNKFGHSHPFQAFREYE